MAVRNEREGCLNGLVIGAVTWLAIGLGLTWVSGWWPW